MDEKHKLWTDIMPEVKFISRNFKHLNCGGGIAKSDIDILFERFNFKNIGLKRSFYRNNIVHAVRNFAGVLKALCCIHTGDTVILQYPVKLFFYAICAISKLKRANIICLIHDLSSFRNKSITQEEEITRLNKCQVILTHNYRMREWLSAHGCRSKMIDYKIMDYIHWDSTPSQNPSFPTNYSIFYVGNTSFKTHPYIRKLAELLPHRQIYLYGSHVEPEADKYPNLHYMGFVADSEIIKSHKGDFGLSWYGESLDDGIGRIGEYMAYNNPHKVSLYLRCNSPVIVWDKAGRADFIRREKIGITVDSLYELDDKLNNISVDEYNELTGNVRVINSRLKDGYYLRSALNEAFTYLSGCVNRT